MASVVLLAWIVSRRFGRDTQRDRHRDRRHRPRERERLDCFERLIRGCRLGGPHERRRHGRLRGDKPRRRAGLRGACAGEPGAWRRQCLRRAAAADRVEPRGSTNPAIVVLWTAKSASGTRLVSARSNDGGKSFGQAESVPGSDASGNRGWESAAVTPSGDVVAVWLDHREVPARTAGATTGAHQHGATSQRPAADGVARAQLSQIFFARLNDPLVPARSLLASVTAARRRLRPALTGLSSRPGDTSTQGTFATSRWRNPLTADERLRRRCASAKTTGCSTGVQKTDPLSRSIRRMRSTWCGPRWFEARQVPTRPWRCSTRRRRMVSASPSASRSRRRVCRGILSSPLGLVGRSRSRGTSS